MGLKRTWNPPSSLVFFGMRSKYLSIYTALNTVYLYIYTVSFKSRLFIETDSFIFKLVGVRVIDWCQWHTATHCNTMQHTATHFDWCQYWSKCTNTCQADIHVYPHEQNYTSIEDPQLKLRAEVQVLFGLITQKSHYPRLKFSELELRVWGLTILGLTICGPQKPGCTHTNKTTQLFRIPRIPLVMDPAICRP